MKLTLPFSTHRFLAVILLTLSFDGLPPASSHAANATAETGARLLLAELPANTSILDADCDQLAAAVGKATLAHQPEAPAILRVALSRGTKKLKRGEGKLPCPCARRIFSVSVAAAPTQASALLDLATELYPDCAPELASALRDYDQVAYDYKDRANDKNVVDPKDSTVRSADSRTTAQSSVDPNAAADPYANDLSNRDILGLGLTSPDGTFGFGTGFGPGFPGSPGFIGSSPSGGFALPPGVVTAVVNG